MSMLEMNQQMNGNRRPIEVQNEEQFYFNTDLKSDHIYNEGHLTSHIQEVEIIDENRIQ